jgi:hypothetical protein
MNKEGIDKLITNPEWTLSQVRVQSTNICVLAKFIKRGFKNRAKFIHSFICIAWRVAGICVLTKFIKGFSEIMQNLFIHLHCMVGRWLSVRPQVNRQHQPVHHEGWMVSDRETIFCWVPVCQSFVVCACTYVTAFVPLLFFLVYLVCSFLYQQEGVCHTLGLPFTSKSSVP